MDSLVAQKLVETLTGKPTTVHRITRNVNPIWFIRVEAPSWTQIYRVVELKKYARSHNAVVIRPIEPPQFRSSPNGKTHSQGVR